VTRHFFYFIGCTTRNRLRRQLRRLRSPRYAVAALAGLAYFFFLFGPWAGGDAGTASGPHFLNAARSLGPLFVGSFAAWWWLWGGHRRGLVLTPAETHLLVPAPLTRGELVRFKILQAQVPILFSVAIGAFVTRGTALPWPARVASLWVLLATLHQHQIAASLVHAAAGEQGRLGVRRQLVPLLFFTVGFATVGWAVVRAAFDISAAATLEFAVQRLAGVMDEPAPRIVLTPFRLLLAPLLATSFGTWLPAFLLALGVLGAHYFWVQRTNSAFEETAAREGEQAAARLAALHSGDLARLRFSAGDRPARLARPLLPLAATGLPAGAVFWKNLVYAQRAVRPTAVLALMSLGVLILTPLLLSSVSVDQGLWRAGMAFVAIGAFVSVAGPFGIRNDLRMDLRHIELLRTLPLAGPDLVAAEIAAAVAAVTALQLPLLAAGILLLSASGQLAFAHTILAAVLAVPLLAALNSLSVTVQNAIVLLYPGWIRIGEHGAGGMETVGQNLLNLIATMLLLGLAAVPPLLVGGAVGAPLMLVSPLLALPVAVLATVVAVGAEVFVCTRWLGRLYDRTDPVVAGLLR
jgi:ABC-2 type transport system permease protein